MKVNTNEMEGIAWMITSAFCFAMTTSIVRHLAVDLHPLVMLFFRNIFAVPVLFLVVFRPGQKLFTTPHLPMHFLRAVIAMSAMGLWFYAITIMPLPAATALSFTTPLFTTIAAILILKERAGWHRWIALFIGFLGVLIILHPTPASFSYTSLFVLLAAVGWAISNVQAKALSRVEKPKLMVFYLTLFMTPLSFVPAFLAWQSPTLEQVCWLIAMSLVSNFSHFSLSKAVSKTEIMVILPFDFMRLVFISAIAYVVFSQVVDLYTIVGAGIIVGSAVYIAQREAKLKKLKISPEEMI